jgi:hypothetical protein
LSKGSLSRSRVGVGEEAFEQRDSLPVSNYLDGKDVDT